MDESTKVFETMRVLLMYMASGRKITIEAPCSGLKTLKHFKKKPFIDTKYRGLNS